MSAPLVLTPMALALTGLAGSGHCLWMCGLLIHGGRHLPTWPERLAFQFGRALAYAALGTAVGALGSGLLLRLPETAIDALRVAALLVLLWSVLRRAPAHHCSASRSVGGMGVARALGRGLLLGLMPCPLLVSVLAVVAVTADAAAGAGLMLAFALGGALPQLLAGEALARLGRQLSAPLPRQRALAATGMILLAGGGVLATLGHLPWSVFCR